MIELGISCKGKPNVQLSNNFNPNNCGFEMGHTSLESSVDMQGSKLPSLSKQILLEDKQDFGWIK